MSKSSTSFLTASFTFATLWLSSIAFAADKPVSDAAKAAYPLTTCVVSGDKLVGDMGGPIDYTYKQAGQPDRLVRFCCKDCIKDFEKEPAKYLKQIDEAAAAKAKSAAKQ